MSKRCELQKEYYKEYGNYKGYGKYSDDYVRWLEDEVLALRIADVVLSEERTESDCDCKKYPHVYSYDNKPCCKNCGREWVAS